MNNKLLIALAVFSLTACKTQKKETQKEMYHWPAVKPPVAETKAHWRTIHGDSVLDNYYWMYDYFGKGPDSTKVVDYLKAENAYLDTMMSGTRPLQEALFTEMKGRIKEKDENV
ncbi:MAG TPA: hypothetical protein PLN30_02755, partial [Ferruginibacter sp.]|nr:hypothetical protein [Ferruginibacter sp.]